MWKFESTAETSGDTAAVWRAWEDASHWNSWNPMIQQSGLNGPFATGTAGFVDPTKGPKAGFVLTSVQPERSWSSRAKMPGGALDFFYELVPLSTGTRIVMRAEIHGPLWPLYSILVGRPVKQGLPTAVRNLKARAEQPAATA
ncbi:MAG TPA: SRPBCC family protein [Dehalococcoidia bacterium]|nr:SRPBCC family protein [Dehalococcoidia bacterium]